MPAEFTAVVWDNQLVTDCRQLIQLALEEDLNSAGDLTTHAVVQPSEGNCPQASAAIVAREAGVLAGLPVIPLVIDALAASVTWETSLEDGAELQPGTEVGVLAGAASQILTLERTVLNFLGRLTGIASKTALYVAETAGGAAVYDTRKTTPGWRRLEKYAVRCGGGCNHRTGLFDAVLIKDNHLALSGEAGLTPADAVLRAREWLTGQDRSETVVEVEVDTLEQLQNVLQASPDIVLLDNMSNEQLRQAVAIRDESPSKPILEASGGVRLETIGAIAQTGVDRISVGGLTHSARCLDLGLDWQ